LRAFFPFLVGRDPTPILKGVEGEGGFFFPPLNWKSVNPPPGRRGGRGRKMSQISMFLVNSPASMRIGKKGGGKKKNKGRG